MKKYQTGLATSGLILLIVIGIFGVWLFLKLFPLYMENRKVTAVLEQVRTNPEALKKTNTELQRLVYDGLREKELDRITQENMKNHISVTRGVAAGEGFEITVQYQQEVPINSTLSFLNRFEKTVEAP